MAYDSSMIERRQPGDELILPVIPLRGMAIFPDMVLHFDIGREKSINAMEKAMVKHQYVFLTAQKDENTDLPTADDFYQIGVIAKIKQMLKLPGDTIRVLVEGGIRGEIVDVIKEVPYFECEVRELPDPEIGQTAEMEALMRATLGAFGDYMNANPEIANEVYAAVASIKAPGAFADAIAAHLDVKVEDKQKILECLDIRQRLTTLSELLLRELPL